MTNYYVVCTCELGSTHPTGPVKDCSMHGEPNETWTEVSGEEELFIDMSEREDFSDIFVDRSIPAPPAHKHWTGQTEDNCMMCAKEGILQKHFPWIEEE